jgi:hypothetical protein
MAALRRNPQWMDQITEASDDAGKLHQEELRELLEFAQEYFRLHKKGEDGFSLLQTIQSAAKQGNPVAVAQLAAANQTICPPTMVDVWDWFLRLRSHTSDFCPVVSETEIRAFFINRRIRPSIWQIDTIIMLDNLYRAGPQPTE